jgi:hypothetical protein
MDGCQAAEQSGKKYHDFPFLKKMSFLCAEAASCILWKGSWWADCVVMQSTTKV